MKKTMALVLTGLLTVGTLAGCGGSPQSNNAQGGSGSAAPETVKPELELIVAHNQTSLENPYAIGTMKFKEVAEEVSGGKISVVLHHGTLGESEPELVEKLTMGAASMIVASPALMTGIGVTEVDMFSLLYLFDSFDHWESAVDGEFGEEMKGVITEKTNNQFKVMGYWSSGVRNFYGKKAIVTPQDASGLTIRTQSSAVQQELWANAGAIPTSVSWGELYQALQQGVVDSAENDYTSFMLKDHHKTANGKFISETEHDYTTRLFLMDGNFYEKLTADQKAWIEEASIAATEAERQTVYKMADESKAKVIADGATVTEHADMDIEAFRAIALPIQEKFVTDNNMEKYLEMIRSMK
jgi:TRAP-type C4-dicarboxylate transport system substrate-binding protein